MQKAEVHLVYVTDVGYLMPTTVSMASAYAWCDAPARLVTHIVDIGIPDDEWDSWLADIVKKLPTGARIIRHVLPSGAMDGFPTYRGTAATCARAYIPDLLSDVGWCFYVDGDTMFFDDPLKAESIFDDKYAFQAHADRLESRIAEDEHRIWFERHGMIWDVAQYGCAGVLLMNLKWMRAHDIGARLIDFMKRYLDSQWPDQDALYWECRGHVKFLPDEWGMMDDHLCQSAKTVPSCLHYVDCKPWNIIHIRQLCNAPVGWEWFRSAKILTGYSADELVKKGRQFVYAGSNSLGWFWRALFFSAARIPEWKRTHEYRLRFFPPAFIMRHISANRLSKRFRF